MQEESDVRAISGAMEEADQQHAGAVRNREDRDHAPHSGSERPGEQEDADCEEDPFCGKGRVHQGVERRAECASLKLSAAVRDAEVADVVRGVVVARVGPGARGDGFGDYPLGRIRNQDHRAQQ